IAVGAPLEDVGGSANQGRAYVFSGVDGSLLVTLESPNPQADAEFGYSLAMGDVNGDGKADIAAGAPLEDVGGNANQGRAYVFSGIDGSLLLTLESPNPQAEAQFGWSLAAGDVNGDGKADIAVGAPLEDVGGNVNQGRAYVFSGVDGSLVLTLDSPNPLPNAQFGYSLAMGDVGDGYVNDGCPIVGGHPDCDWNWDYDCEDPGEDALCYNDLDDDLDGYVNDGCPVVGGHRDCDANWDGDDCQDPGEAELCNNGLDDDRDGKADIAVGARKENVDDHTGQGRAYVFLGTDASLLFSLDTTNPHWLDYFGVSVAMGVVNGDDRADIVVGASGEFGEYGFQGRAYVFSGFNASLLLTLANPNPQLWAQFGWSVAVGDVNGDGWADIAVGANPGTVGVEHVEGRVYVFSSPCQAGVDTDLDDFDDAAECYLGTDTLDNCPDNSSNDAWPLDINIDTFVTVVGDVYAYSGRMGAWGGPPPSGNWWQRLDLNMDNYITAVGDVLKFAGKMGASCT
ncbi:MAG: FG-GAP repeat protein, partial [Dehalococcoidia bacterium]